MAIAQNYSYVRNLEGDEFALDAVVENDYDLNGNQKVTCTIEANKTNNLFIHDISEMWILIDHDGVEHKITYTKHKGKGDKFAVDVKGMPLFFDTFTAQRIYETYDEHLTAKECFDVIFEGSGYDYLLSGSFKAIQWEGFGKGDARIDLFKKALDRYKAEFTLQGNTVILENLIGSDTDIQYRHKLNASNVQQEIDATAFWTYAKGFGNFEEGGENDAKLEREYTSPLAELPGIGKRHAPPVYDGRITDKDTMDEKLKELVENSLKISVTADVQDLRDQGYKLAQPKLGDRIYLIDGRIGLNKEVRVVGVKMKRAWNGDILDLKLTLGAQSLRERHQSDLKNAVQDIKDLFSGAKKIETSMLDASIQLATEALKSAQTELAFTDNGIIATDKNDPNLVTVFNSAGIGVSSDGGQTFENALTGMGINASMIVTGVLNAVDIEGVNINGTNINGSEINGTYINGSEITGSSFETTSPYSRAKIINGSFNSENLAAGIDEEAMLSSGFLVFESNGGNNRVSLDSSRLGLSGAGGQRGSLELLSSGSYLHVDSVVADTVRETSVVDRKTDIKELSFSALETLVRSGIYEYMLDKDKEAGSNHKRYGFVIGEGYSTPEQVKSSDGKGVVGYSHRSLNTAAIQELAEENKQLRADLQELERRIQKVEGSA